MFKEWGAERKLRRFLSECNLEMARDQLIHMLKGGVISNELAQLLDKFLAGSTVDNAISLIKYDRKLLDVFYLTRKGGFARGEYERGHNG